MTPGGGEGAAVRDAVEDDLAAVRDIYAHYVANSFASFELAPPDLAEITRRWREIRASDCPYIVAETASGIGGFAYAFHYRRRPAYRHTIEDSVYVSPPATGHGLGKALLADLIRRCTGIGFRQMIAVIGGADNDASIRLHAGAGFDRVGVLPASGYKSGRWVDTILMQRALGDGASTPPGG